MNWPKLKEKYPKAHDELRILHEMTGLLGEFLLDEYFEFHNKEKSFLRLKVLQEIESELVGKESETTKNAGLAKPTKKIEPILSNTG